MNLNPLDQMELQIVEVIREALAGYVEQNTQVAEFSQRKAAQYSQQFWIWKRAKTEEERQEALGSLEHVIKRVSLDLHRLDLPISEDAKNTVSRVVMAVGIALVRLSEPIAKIAA